MKTILTIAALSLAASPATAATMRPSQAMTAQGQYVLVEGTAHVQQDTDGGFKVVLTDSGTGHLFLNIPDKVKSDISDLSSYDGKMVDVRGIVEIGQRGPQISLSRADQLKLASP